MASLDKSFPKPGIELYSGKYFAACGLGGIIGPYNPNVPTPAHALMHAADNCN
jgi:hypothetical protein